MSSKPLVSIAGKEGALKNAKTALTRLDLTGLRGKSVLIKPNLARMALPGRGYNTYPDTIAGVIEVLKDVGAGQIAVGESPIVGIDTMAAFEKGGVTAVGKRYNVPLLDFDAEKPIIKEIPNPRIVAQTQIASAVYEYDILLSLPVAKTHMHTGVTLGIKNMKGCLYRHEKVRYHQLEYQADEYPEKTLDSAVSDLATILMPDLTLIDGYIGMEGLGPSGGRPVKSDFAVASWHPMGADVYGCLMMGLCPADMVHLRLVSERIGLSLNPEDYEPSPSDFHQFVHLYEKPPKSISLEYKNVVVYDCESCSACLSTLMLFLRRFQHEMSPYLLDDNNFHIAIGKGVNRAKEGTVYVGSCTKEHKTEGIYVKGCPPVPTRIYEAVTGREPDENEPEVE